MPDNILWVPPAFFGSIMLAGIFLLNQYYKLPGKQLVLYSRLVVIAVLIPVLLALNLPTDPVFYIAVFVTAVFAAIGDARCFDICAQYGGGVVSRLQALTIWVSFFLWLAIRPETLQTYIERPLWTLGILGALGGCFYFSFSMRKCEVSRAAFLAVLPIVTMYGANMVLAKIAMEHSDLHNGVFGYVLVQSVLVVCFIGLGMWFRREPTEDKTTDREAITAPPLKKTLATGALLMAFFWLSQVALKNYAFTFSANPAYVAAVMETSPVWILLFYRMTGHKEEANVKAGIGIMLSAVVLSVLTIR